MGRYTLKDYNFDLVDIVMLKISLDKKDTETEREILLNKSQYEELKSKLKEGVKPPDKIFGFTITECTGELR